MADKRPVVLKSGELEQLQSGDTLIDPTNNRPFNDIYLFTNVDTTDFNIGDVCFYNIGIGIMKAKADNINNCSGMLWISTQFTTVANNGLFRPWGLSEVSPASLTPGTPYFLSPTTAGKVTDTPPSTAGHVIIKVGSAVTSSIMIFKVEPAIILA